MNVSLKKAHSLQLALSEVFDSIALHNSISLNEFQDAEMCIKDARQKLIEKFDRKDRIVTARYDIRNLVDAANYKNGISEKLTRIACLNKTISMYEAVLKTIRDDFDSAEIIQKKLEKLRTVENRIRINDSVSTTLLTEDHAEKMRKSLADAKKVRASIVDEVSELNVSSKIMLTDFIVEVLTDEQLI